MEMFRELAAVAKDFVCSVARKTYTCIDVSKDDIVFKLCCSDCDGKAKEAGTPMKQSPVSDNVLAPFLELGRQVRLSLVSLLQSVSSHCTLSPAAVQLWLSCVTDQDKQVRQTFADNIGWILR